MMRFGFQIGALHTSEADKLMLRGMCALMTAGADARELACNHAVVGAHQGEEPAGQAHHRAERVGRVARHKLSRQERLPAALASRRVGGLRHSASWSVPRSSTRKLSVVVSEDDSDSR